MSRNARSTSGVLAESVATWCYACAIILMPVGVASKFLLGVEGITWIDPTLLLTVIAGIALFPAWGDFAIPPLRNLTFGSAVLVLLSCISATSGVVLRPPADLYAAVREPIRFALVLGWMLVSAWFFLNRPVLALRCAVCAVVLALTSGVYLQLAAASLVPAPANTALYMRLYMLRQSVWFHGFPIPRMGGLFVEAPPFGLFMISMLASFGIARACGMRHLVRWGARLALLGVILSLATQVWLGLCAAVAAWIVRWIAHRPLRAWPLTSLAACLLALFAVLTFHDFALHNDASPAADINGNSIGERTFHFEHGIEVGQERPLALISGIGPGRYGEYAADTGLFPASVTMQSSAPELLVEWGALGLTVWCCALAAFGLYLWRLRRLSGIAWFAAVVIADSFQANWKAEAVAFALAAMYALPRREQGANPEPLTALSKLPVKPAGAVLA